MNENNLEREFSKQEKKLRLWRSRFRVETYTPLSELRINIDLQEECWRYEGWLIWQALFQTNRKVSEAAKLLGMSHQGLLFILNNRHSELVDYRKPVKTRRKFVARG